MQKLSISKRAAILRCLIEGNSILSTSRITGAAKNSIVKLLEQAGEACLQYQNDHMRDLPCKVLQLDEVHSFVGCLEKTKPSAKLDHEGEIWLWTALDAETKIIPCWHVGDRSGRSAFAFCADLKTRLTCENPQITTDGLASYRWAMAGHFPKADYGQVVKIYSKDENGMDIVLRADKRVVFGNPNVDLISTSYVERSNLTVRMTNRRFTRKTNAFSKKLENHQHMLAVMFFNYNYCRKHTTLKETPAMAAKIEGRQWTLEDVIEMMDTYLERKLEAEYERAFEIKFTRPRTMPKSYPPQTPKVPWYLDPNSGGNPDLEKS